MPGARVTITTTMRRITYDYIYVLVFLDTFLSLQMSWETNPSVLRQAEVLEVHGVHGRGDSSTRGCWEGGVGSKA